MRRKLKTVEFPKLAAYCLTKFRYCKVSVLLDKIYVKPIYSSLKVIGAIMPKYRDEAPKSNVCYFASCYSFRKCTWIDLKPLELRSFFLYVLRYSVSFLHSSFNY